MSMRIADLPHHTPFQPWDDSCGGGPCMDSHVGWDCCGEWAGNKITLDPPSTSDFALFLPLPQCTSHQ